jgi:ribosomal-protein-alanine N-acetyltransferase
LRVTAPTFPVRIEGPRLTLREFEPGDLDASLTIVGDPEVTRWLSFDTRGRAEQAERLAQDITRAQSTPRPDYFLAIVEPDGRFVGFARLGLGPHRSGEVGYAVRRDRWGRGYATEAAALLIEFGFRRLHLHRIVGSTGPDNEASQAVLRRLGFTREGVMRDHVFTAGAWRDSVLYALLEDEWPGLRDTPSRATKR